MAEHSQENNFAQWQAKIDGMIAKLQHAVEANDWEMVNELLTQRQHQLEAFLQSPIAKAQPQALVQWLQQIKRQDQLMEAQIKQQQAAVKQVLDQVGKGRKAVDAYRSL